MSPSLSTAAAVTVSHSRRSFFAIGGCLLLLPISSADDTRCAHLSSVAARVSGFVHLRRHLRWFKRRSTPSIECVAVPSERRLVVDIASHTGDTYKMRRLALVAVLVMSGMSLIGSARADVRPELRANVADEGDRLVLHFHEVLGELKARDTSHMTPAQLLKRNQLISLLRTYQDRGLFPENRDFDKNTPYFIDGSGTRCAMAYLIEESGGRDLVARVAEKANNAYVKELATDRQLLQWLEIHGLSLQEAARIQPTYNPPACPENCRDDEQCTYGDDGNECSRFCDPSNDSCGTSDCEGQLNGEYVCSPAVRSEGPRPESDDDSCSVAGSGGSATLLLLAVFFAYRRRRSN